MAKTDEYKPQRLDMVERTLNSGRWDRIEESRISKDCSTLPCFQTISLAG